MERDTFRLIERWIDRKTEIEGERKRGRGTGKERERERETERERERERKRQTDRQRYRLRHRQRQTEGLRGQIDRDRLREKYYPFKKHNNNSQNLSTCIIPKTPNDTNRFHLNLTQKLKHPPVTKKKQPRRHLKLEKCVKMGEAPEVEHGYKSPMFLSSKSPRPALNRCVIDG